MSKIEEMFEEAEVKSFMNEFKMTRENAVKIVKNWKKKQPESFKMALNDFFDSIHPY